MRKSVKIGLGTVALLAAGVAVYWHIEARQCERRGEAYKARIAELEAAAMRVSLGAPKETVAQFSRENRIGLSYSSFDGANHAFGNIAMEACSPGWYCGAAAVILVEFKFDTDWRVVSHKVSGAYSNCL